MMNNNKILTVSYGTFSCTLEGFEDSFGTMKAIAEYFRDLAADDRYFGAEPPQPDAEMLARIAQKEISRRVEAREHEGRIVLSAHEEQPAVAAPAALATTAAAVATQAQAPAFDEAPEADVAPAESAPHQEAPAEEVAVTETAALAEALQPVQPDVAGDMAAMVGAAVTEDMAEDEPVLASDEAPAEDVSELSEVAETFAEDDTLTEDQEMATPQIEPAADVAYEPADMDTDADVTAELANDAPEVDDAFALTEGMAADAEEAPAVAEQMVGPSEALDESTSEMDIVPSLPDDDVEAFFGDASSDAPELYEGEEALDPVPVAEFENVDPTPAASTDSIADKLERIRAVVSRHQDADEAPDYTEDEHAEADAVADAPSLIDEMTIASEEEDATDTSEDVMSSALRDLNNALMADDEAEEDAQYYASDRAEDLEDENDDVTDILNRLDRADMAEADEDDTALDDDTILFDDSLVGDLMADDTASDDIDETDDATVAENLFDDADEEQLPDAMAEDISKADEEMPEEDIAAPRARVIKVKRVELEAAITSGTLEEIADDGKVSSLSDVDEAELARELAEVEAELGEDAADIPHVATADEAEDVADAAELDEEFAEAQDTQEDADYLDEDTHSAARNVLPSIDDEQDSDISRLLAETNSQMGDEESATRRDAFAHLRAAVAAKKADVEAGGADTTEEEDGAYRDDLASVVRPRRPATTAGRTARPSADARPAPLKLVAEQRIDIDQVRSSGPVRPRRVAALEDSASMAGDASSFAEFAADMGASKLPDLLEAAAAYMSFVEGREQFSRPQLMTKVRQVEQDDFSREDSLRSFGKLLRDGKIEKIKGGRFQVSEQIGFRPDERAAG